MSAPFVASFASQWLALDRLRAVPIDLERFPRFLYTITRGERRGQEVSNRPTIRDWMHAETVAFVHDTFRFPGTDETFFDLMHRLAARGLDVRVLFWRHGPETARFAGDTFAGTDDQLEAFELG